MSVKIPTTVEGFEVKATVWCPNHRRTAAILQRPLDIPGYTPPYVIELLNKDGSRGKHQPDYLWSVMADTKDEALTNIKEWDDSLGDPIMGARFQP